MLAWFFGEADTDEGILTETVNTANDLGPEPDLVTVDYRKASEAQPALLASTQLQAQDFQAHAQHFSDHRIPDGDELSIIPRDESFIEQHVYGARRGDVNAIIGLRSVRRGTRVAVDAAMLHVSHDIASIRVEALLTLGLIAPIGDEDVICEIVPCLGHSEPCVRKAAVTALQHISEDTNCHSTITCAMCSLIEADLPFFDCRAALAALGQVGSHLVTDVFRLVRDGGGTLYEFEACTSSFNVNHDNARTSNSQALIIPPATSDCRGDFSTVSVARGTHPELSPTLSSMSMLQRSTTESPRSPMSMSSSRFDGREWPQSPWSAPTTCGSGPLNAFGYPAFLASDLLAEMTKEQPRISSRPSLSDTFERVFEEDREAFLEEQNAMSIIHTATGSESTITHHQSLGPFLPTHLGIPSVPLSADMRRMTADRCFA